VKENEIFLKGLILKINVNVKLRLSHEKKTQKKLNKQLTNFSEGVLIKKPTILLGLRRHDARRYKTFIRKWNRRKKKSHRQAF